jgi:hypothetical protein
MISILLKPKGFKIPRINIENTNNLISAIRYNFTVAKHIIIFHLDSSIPSTDIAKGDVACHNIFIGVCIGSGIFTLMI